MKNLNINELMEKINQFVRQRNWEIYHTPRNLASSISIESSELLEHFQWEDLSKKDIKFDEEKIKDISDELADVMIYCLRLMYELDLDFEKIILDKIEENKIKYPLPD